MYSELEEVLKFIPQKVDELGIVALHRELAGLYENARNSPSPEVTTQINDCMARLENAQEALEPEGWESTKVKIFEKIGGAKILGNTGLNNLEDEMNQLSNDPHGVSEILNRYAAEIEALKQKVQQAVENLGSLFTQEAPLPEGMKRVEIVFDKNVSVEGFGDMAAQASEWNKILKSLKNTILEPSEDGHFWRIYKSSPTVIIFFLPIPQAASMIEIVKNVLEIVAALLLIRTYQKNSEASPLDEKHKSKILDIVAQYEKQRLSEEINNKVETLLKGTKLTGTHRTVAKVSFTHIVKRIYNFFVEGGTVNPIDKVKEEETPEDAAAYRETFEKVQRSLKLEISKPLLLAEFSESEEKTFEKIVSEPVLIKEIKEVPVGERDRPTIVKSTREEKKERSGEKVKTIAPKTKSENSKK